MKPYQTLLAVNCFAWVPASCVATLFKIGLGDRYTDCSSTSL